MSQCRDVTLGGREAGREGVSITLRPSANGLENGATIWCILYVGTWHVRATNPPNTRHPKCVSPEGYVLEHMPSLGLIK